MRLKRKMVAFFSVAMLLASFMGVQAAAMVPVTVEQFQYQAEEISPRKDKIDWLYKVENGKLYRRLFNYSKNEWIGDWELCP